MDFTVIVYISVEIEVISIITVIMELTKLFK